MNLLHLKYAVIVAETNSMTKAAEMLFTAQPNLSRAIKELESGLGITIFRRTPKGMVPTAQGEIFLRYANNVLEQVERMEALGRAEGEAQRFRVMLPHSTYTVNAALRLVDQIAYTPRSWVRVHTADGRSVDETLNSGEERSKAVEAMSYFVTAVESASGQVANPDSSRGGLMDRLGGGK